MKARFYLVLASALLAVTGTSSAVTRYVDANCATPSPPYINWATAARVIQDAVDAAVAGDEIVVTNGLYATGGRAVGTNLLVNRVAVDKPLSLRSVNGPQVTIIQGYQLPGTTNGDGAVRCAYLADGVSLSGFTLKNGATRTFWDEGYRENSGGGLWCESTNALAENCVLMGNAADSAGGGAYRGNLKNCTLIGNSADSEHGAGGGANWATLTNCALSGNSAWLGGGVYHSTLDNCTLADNAATGGGGGAAYCALSHCILTGNSAQQGGGAEGATLNNCIVNGNRALGNDNRGRGGGAFFSFLNNCTVSGNSAAYGGGVSGIIPPFDLEYPCVLNNCIVYFNTATAGADYGSSTYMNYSCTTPMPTNGIGNITNAPLFVDAAAGNYCLRSDSPCINAGNNAYAPGTADLDGNPRIVSGTVDIGAYEFQGLDSAGFRITSLSQGSNGTTVIWTKDGVDQAYTLQVRNGLTTGNWSPAPSRYRWPIVANHWTEPPASMHPARFYRVEAESIQPPDRGKVLSVSLRQSYTTNSAKSTLANNGLGAVSVQWPVLFYKLLYETVDPFGLPITASGALYLPQGPTNALPLCSYQHGMTMPKSAAPSAANLVPENAFGIMFATAGYVVLLPDYIGVGDSPGYPAYAHAATEASAVVDMLKAVRNYCATNGTPLNGQVFLTGYSQGGHATMAAHRVIEASYTNEFVITASAPLGGGYDLSGIMLDSVLTNYTYPAGPAIAAVLTAYLPVYQLADTLEELLRSPYRQTLPPLLDGYHQWYELGAAMPGDILSILRPDYHADLHTNLSNGLRLALRDNNVYEWTPQAPTRLYHCGGDTVNPYAMAVMVYQNFTNNGATSVSLLDPGWPQKLDHGACMVPSILAAKQWFDSLKQ